MNTSKALSEIKTIHEIEWDGKFIKLVVYISKPYIVPHNLWKNIEAFPSETKSRTISLLVFLKVWGALMDAKKKHIDWVRGEKKKIIICRWYNLQARKDTIRKLL